MHIKIQIKRVDGGCEPYAFVESRFDNLSVAREQMAKAIEKFNDWADKTNQVRLEFSVELMPIPDVAIATPNAREAARLAAQSQK